MNTIYEPKGKAREYSPLALNLYQGCAHRCFYCYCPSVLHCQPAAFFARSEPRPGVIAALHDAVHRYAGDTRPILLSFTSDPYQPAEAKHGVTRLALEMLGEAGLRANVLTKNPGLAVTRDVDVLLRYGVTLGTTLTAFHWQKAEQWEPGAPSPVARMHAIADAKRAGLQTWVSLEPVIDPDETMLCVYHVGADVDVFKIGKWNYDPRAKSIGWDAFVRRIVHTLRIAGKAYYIKDDLWAECSEETRATLPKTTVTATSLGAQAVQQLARKANAYDAV